ncbi:MAG: hypothetical protein AAFX06_29515 [Planctomycetota bacterium]
MKAKFTIFRLLVLTTFVAILLAVVVIFTRPPEPRFWDSGISNANSIQRAETILYGSSGWTDWRPMPVKDAFDLISIVEKCPLQDDDATNLIFPAPTSVVKIYGKERAFELEVLGSGISVRTSDYSTAITQDQGNAILEAVDPEEIFFKRESSTGN